MKKQIAFVFGGGGARGALQVGALRALLEAHIYPDILAGTSVGAINASFLALHGANLTALEALERAWQDTLAADLLPDNYLWLTVRTLFGRSGNPSGHRMRQFFIDHGLLPELCFGDLQGPRLLIVAADLNHGQPVIFGEDPAQSVLDAVLASTALPPWVTPIESEERSLIDGAAVSPLPIEPAMRAGANEIIALDLADPRQISSERHDFGAYINKLIVTVELRHIELELALAAARRIPVRHFLLQSETPIPIWDFHHTEELFKTGYILARQQIAAEGRQPDAKWLNRLPAWVRNLFPR